MGRLRAVSENWIPGRRYWRDQLDEIDDELRYRFEDEGRWLLPAGEVNELT